MPKERPVPESFLLLKYGDNSYTKDGKSNSFSFNEKHADDIIAEFCSRGRDLVVDFEHSSLSGNVAPAAGWIDQLEKTPEGLTCHIKYWTDQALEYLQKGEYRYFSPTLLFARGSAEPNALHSVALTNHPALHGLDALVASDTPNQTSDQSDRSDLADLNQRRKTMTKTEIALRKLLGDTALALSDDQDESVAARLEALAEELPQLRDKASRTEALELADVNSRKTAAFDRGARRGAFCNAQKDTLLRLALEDLEALEKETPDNAAFPATKLPTPAPTDEQKKTEELTDEEKEIAKKMNLSDEEFLAAKKAQEKENE